METQPQIRTHVNLSLLGRGIGVWVRVYGPQACDTCKCVLTALRENKYKRVEEKNMEK